ncbi:extracellular solute-binding protein [Mesorhizobium sp. CU2]|uniref:ABC transporter substrate-binding protein n=1 Tax=unclassified Mesorhizobium TaxID=325217 RepID=UPI00112E991E|nr:MULTISPECIES: extracellular solute-binding protein [unclassified Mesorhizobium]TPN81063.1 extracellular solute-binding protein [Mesorhizobium sp. CU3]TPO09818.1 extracellular solute-binding protein [Mesorhizobium sp. CU2]
MIESELTRRRLLKMAGTAGAAYLSGSAVGNAASSDSLVYIGWSHTEAGSKPFLDSTFKQFRMLNEGVALETIGVPFNQMETTLLLRKRSNQKTDVGQLAERWLPGFASAGGMFDVDEVFGKEFVDATYHPSALAMTLVNGRRYALPWAIGSVGLVGHAKVLADAGVSEMPVLIDAFLDALRKVKKDKPSSSPMGFSTKNPALTQFEAQLFFWTFGGSLFSDDGEVVVDSNENRQALTLLADMVKEGLILPGNDRFDIRRLFAQEQVAFYPDPPLARAFARAQSGQGKAYDHNVIPVAMPVVAADRLPVCIQWGHLLGMFDYGGAKASPDGASGKFVKLLSQTEIQIEYYKQTGVFPSTKAALAAMKDDSYLVTWIGLTNTARPDELTPFANANEMRTVIGEEIAAAMLGQKTPSEALTNMSDRLKAIGPRK